MGTKYSSQATSGYNASPPPDDGSQTASNLITWAGIKTKLADVLKTFGEAINTALVAALNLSARAVSSDDSGVAGDHWRSIQLTGGATFTLPDAATVGVGWVVTVVNIGTSIARIARTTSGDTLNGVATNVNLSPGDSVTIKVNAAGNGFIIDSARSVDLSRVEGRLTLSASTPVPSGDVTSATAVRFTPYKGNKIALFDGTGTWHDLAFTEKSLTAPAAANTVYDVFGYNDAGVLSIEALAWTNVSSRATALILQDGVLVRSGATNKRYLGTFCTTSIAGQVEDSRARRLVWNYYNRVRRGMLAVESTNSWSYSLAAFHQANANATNQLDFVVGVAEDAVTAKVVGIAANDTGNQIFAVGIGLNSTTVNSAQLIGSVSSAVANRNLIVVAEYQAVVPAGKSSLVWLEFAEATGVTTWVGDGNVLYAQSGIKGEIFA